MHPALTVMAGEVPRGALSPFSQRWEIPVKGYGNALNPWLRLVHPQSGTRRGHIAVSSRGVILRARLPRGEEQKASAGSRCLPEVARVRGSRQGRPVAKKTLAVAAQPASLAVPARQVLKRVFDSVFSNNADNVFVSLGSRRGRLAHCMKRTPRHGTGHDRHPNNYQPTL